MCVPQVQNNLCTPKNGEILVASTQDFLTSSFLITRKDTFYDRAAFSLMCCYMGDGMDRVDLPTPAILKVRYVSLNATIHIFWSHGLLYGYLSLHLLAGFRYFLLFFTFNESLSATFVVWANYIPQEELIPISNSSCLAPYCSILHE